jgi:putative heme-binding domain-containing protein
MKKIFGLLMLCGSSAFGQNDLKLIPDTDAEKQRQSFILPEGFEINLFASDPMIAKPIQMNWDEQGRLWMVSSRLYPHIKPGQRSDDQVLVLEDTDGDGVADKSTVFAEDLLIPTALMPGDGGVYVANSTEILFLKDNDGDGKADERRVVLSGFGSEDTHHLIHTFRGGPDGMLYFNQSIYIHSHVETPRGVRRLLGGGIWHYRPETEELGVFCKGFVNPWGHIFDRWGQSMATDGAFGEGINYVFPGSVWVTSPGASRIMAGMNPGQPKHCGLEILSGSHLPDDWQGSVVTNDFRGHRVNRFALSESGSGYVSRQVEDLVRTDHGSFRPIDVRMGPDGAIYIADWYNPIIQHGEVDFRDERRDHVHGRIWRITAKGRPLVKKPVISGASAEALLGMLSAKEDWTRHFAKRELRKLDRGVAKAAIDQWVKSLDRGAPETTHLLVEAMWAYQSVGADDGGLVDELLASKDHHARAAAVRWLYHAPNFDKLKVAVQDEHPQVRLEAVNALRQIGTARAAEAAMLALDKPVDKNLDFALWLTARELQGLWLPAFDKGEIDFGKNFKQVIFAMKSSENAAAVGSLIGAVRDGKVSEADKGDVLRLIAEVGGADDFHFLLLHAVGQKDADFLNALAQTSVRRSVTPSGDIGILKPLLADGESVNVRMAAARAAGSWKQEWAREILAGWLVDAALAPELTHAAIDGMASLGDGKAIVTVIDDGARSQLLRTIAVRGLLRVDPKLAAEKAGVLLVGAGSSTEGVGEIFADFLGRNGGPELLAAELEGKAVSAEVATLGAQRIGASGAKNKKVLEEALTKSGGMGPIAQQLNAEEMAAMMELVRTQGDAHRGEAIYHRSQLLCVTCHAISSAGGAIGPDLISIGSSAPVDYIIESLLEPTKKIKEGYHMTVITKKDGGILAGGLLREDDNLVVIRDAAGVEHSLAKSDVVKKEISPVSMMPAGLTASLPRNEFVDLVRFLSELGKEGDFKVSPKRLVRRWRAVDYHEPLSEAVRRSGLTDSVLSNPAWPWRPAYSLVNGALSLEAVGKNFGFNQSELSLVKFEIEVTAAGRIGFKPDDIAGLQMRVGKEMIDLDSGSVELEKGRHEVIAIIDRGLHGKSFSVELLDVAGSPGRAEIVSGL